MFHVERPPGVPRGTLVTPGWNRDASRARVTAALGALELDPPAAACERLLDLCELLAQWASRISLTAHREPGAILDRLVLDAAALAKALPEAETVADLGAGPGIPGLPMAILFPGRQFTLVESRERKHHFQREAVRRLSLENVRTLRGRAEELPANPHAGVVAQAMASPARAVPLLVPWAAQGAWLAIPGGADPPALATPPGVSDVEIRRYCVPLVGTVRTVWIGRRSAVSSGEQRGA